MKGQPVVNIWYFPGTNSNWEIEQAYQLAGFKTRTVFIKKMLTGQVKAQDCDATHVAGGFSEKDAIRPGAIAAAIAQDVLPLLIEYQIPTCFECNGFQIGVEGGCFGDGLVLNTNVCGTFVSRPIKHRLLPSNCLWTDNIAYDLGYEKENPILEFPAAHGCGRLEGSKLDQAKVVMIYEGLSPNGGKIAGITDELGIFFGHMDHWTRRYDNPAGQLILKNLKKHL